MFMKKSGSTLVLWTLSLCWVSIFWTDGQGQPRVVAPSHPITASPGDDVILPCCVEPPRNVENLTVEWSKPELKPDPSDRLHRVGYVHLYRKNEEDLDMKIPSYVLRTRLLKDNLKHGNISLRILNVSIADNGTYRCHIPKLGSQGKDAVVRLVIVPRFVRSFTAEPPRLPRNHPTAEGGTQAQPSGYWSWLIVGIMLGVLLLIACVSWLYVRQQQNKVFQRVMTPDAQHLEPQV